MKAIITLLTITLMEKAVNHSKEFWKSLAETLKWTTL